MQIHRRSAGIRILIASSWLWAVAVQGVAEAHLSSVSDSSSARQDNPPNIVLFVADDLGYGELGCYGQKWIKTPHIDKIAERGIRFTQFYCGQAVCAPSRCSLMTGLHQGHAFIRNNGNPPQRGKPDPEQLYFPGQHPIPDDSVTVAELLKQKGYATACIGKWGLGHVGTSGDPNRQGFDLFYGFNCQVHAHNHYPRFLWRNDEKELFPENDRTLTGGTYSQDKFTEVALEFIRENKDQPFFLYVPFAIPHLSIQVPQQSLNEYVGVIPEEDYEHRGYLQHPSPRAGYAAMISHMDRDIGSIMALLSQLGLEENTLVMFTSDNGPTFDRLGGSDSVFFESAGPLRGRKGSLWDGGIRVPLVAQWPAKIEPGRESDHIGAFWDLLPTFCQAAGADIPDDIDGISMIGALLGQSQPQHEFLYWEFPGYGGQQAVRLGKWKAIRRQLHKFPDAEFQLYDLTTDPGETRNVASEHPQVMERVEQVWRREHIPSDLFKFPALDASGDDPPDDGAVRMKTPARPPSAVAPTQDTSPLHVADKRLPNIVLIISDDAGYADFSSHGSDQISTPRIDSIGADGVHFAQGYVTASVCSPSRAGLMTGRYQQRFGHEMNIPPKMSEANGLPVDEMTMADALQKQGYRTIGLGKWHLGYADHFHPLSRGFHDYYGFLQGARPYWALSEPTQLNRLLHDRQPVDETFGYMTDHLGRRAAEYIDKHHQQPFFLYLSYNAVHTPMHATEDDLNAVSPELSAKRRKLVAMTHALDRSVGFVLDALKQNGLENNTMVVFINDNGGATNNASQNGTLRGKKGSPFEGGIRIPYMVRWPDGWPRGIRYPHPVSTLDLFPTLLAAAGGRPASLPKPLDGVDLTPFVTGENDVRPHPTLFWRRGNNWAIRDGDWKLVNAQGDNPLLFDLSSDEPEQVDVSSSHGEVVARLQREYDNWNAQLVPAKWRTGGGRKRKTQKQ